MAEPENKIIVLDFGGQYAHLIARRIRQLQVYSEIKDPTASLEELQSAKGIIMSGGPASVYDKNAPEFNKGLFSLDRPMLGICYGMQLMAQQLGGKVEPGKTKEFGTATLKTINKQGLFDGLYDYETVWMSHGDRVAELPSGFQIIGSTEDCREAAIANFDKKYFGIQFHAEVVHTPKGMKILENFVLGVCGCKPDWTIEHFAEQKVAEIKQAAGDKRVFLLASGGIDSTVTLCLLNRALEKKRIYAMLVDTGFMRKGETLQVKKALRSLNFSNLHVVDAGRKFFSALKNVAEPEQKRKIVGQLFIDVANEALKKLKLKPDEWILGQGTIYPDTIETQGTKHADRIKTHHNRIESVQQMVAEGRMIEPLRQLYKDEVRELGAQLGLPEEFIWRHPFPGPGLAVRCLCSDGKLKREDLAKMKKAEGKAQEIAERFGLAAKVLPVKSVGVQGDARSYKHPVALIGKADWRTLEKCSTEITNKVHEVNRVIWLLWPEKFKGAKLLKAYLTPKRIAMLQNADSVVNEIVTKCGLHRKIWQFPVVLLPLAINGKKEAVVLRPVYSQEAMTARFADLEIPVVKEMACKLAGVKGVKAVFFDVTHKPPGTIEWE